MTTPSTNDHALDERRPPRRTTTSSTNDDALDERPRPRRTTTPSTKRALRSFAPLPLASLGVGSAQDDKRALSFKGKKWKICQRLPPRLLIHLPHLAKSQRCRRDKQVPRMA